MTISSYSKRVVAYLIDTLIHIGASVVLIGLSIALIFVDGVRALGVFGLVVSVIFLVAFGFYNHVFLQGKSGQTMGKRRQSIVLVQESSYAPPGVFQAFLRWAIVSFLSFATGGIYLIVDLIAPAMGDKKQRITDRLLSLIVVDAGGQVRGRVEPIGIESQFGPY